MNLKRLIFPVICFLGGLTAWIGSYFINVSPDQVAPTLHSATFTLVEAPELTRPPAEETSSRKSVVYLKLQAPLAEPIIAFVNDVAVLPRSTTLDDLLALQAGSVLTVQMDTRQRIWSVSVAGVDIMTEQDGRAAMASRRADSVFGMRFVGSFHILLAMLIGVFQLRARRKRAAMNSTDRLGSP